MSLGEPMLNVFCDGKDEDGEMCHEEIWIDMVATARGGYDDRDAEDGVNSAGWHWVSEDEQYCVDCAVERGLAE